MAMASEEDDVVFKQPLALKPLRRPGVKPVPVVEATKKNNNPVMSSFKLRTLNATLQFVKNDSTMVLRYDDLSIEQEEFVTGLISQCSALSSMEEMDLGFGYKGLYAPLAEAMRIYGLKYEFQLTNEESPNDMKQLKLQKIPKQGTEADHKLSAPSSSHVNSTTKTKKVNKTSGKILKAIERVDETFQRNTVQQIKTFLNDDSKDHLRFDYITPMQMRFVKRMKTIPNKLEYIEKFDVGTRILLDDIRHTITKNTHRFRIEVYQEKNGNKCGYLRCAVMWKMSVGKKLTKKEKHGILNTSGSSANDNMSDTSYTSTGSEQSTSSVNITKLNTVPNKSDTAKSDSAKSDTAKSDIGKNGTAKCGTAKSDTAKSDTGKNGTAKCGTAKSDTGKSGTAKCGTAKRDTAKNVTAKSDTALKTNATKTEPNDDLVLKSLTKLKDFLSDSSQASLMIPEASKVHMTFLENVLRELYKIERFPSHIGTVLKAVYNLVNQNKDVFKVMGEKSYVGKKNDKCDLTLIKTPVYPKFKPQKHISRIETVSSANESHSYPNSTTNTRSEIIKEMDETQNVLSTADGNKDINIAMLLTANNPLEPSPPRTATKRSWYEDKKHVWKHDKGFATKDAKNASQPRNWRDRSVENVRSCSNLPAAAAPIQETRSMTSLAQRTGVTSQPGPKLNRAKEKLIEGLNQPVVSEKGLKMMQMMGWEGGALGVRGEGIVEPISLPIDMARRSGLGHVTQHPITNFLTVDLYTQLPTTITRVGLGQFNKKVLATSTLEALLDLLTTEKGAIEVAFQSKISTKGWSYVSHVVSSLNTKNRKSLFTCGDNPVLIEGILRVMPATNLVVTACWGLAKSNILFVRHKGLYDPSDSGNWCSVIAFQNIQKILKNTVVVKKRLNENKSAENTKNYSQNVQDQTKDNRSAQAITKDNNTAQEKTIDTQNTTDKKMADGDTFRYYILVQILEFCNRPDISIHKGQIVPADRTIQLKGTISSKQVAFIKDLVQRLNNRTRPSSDSKTECSIFKEILQEMAGYDLNVLFPVADNFGNAFKTIILRKIPTQKSRHNKKSITDPNEKDDHKIEKDDVYETLKKAEECPNMFDQNHIAEIIENNLKHVNETLLKNENKENVNNNSRKTINRNTSDNVKTEIIKDGNNDIKAVKNHDIPNTCCKKRRTFTHDSLSSEYMFENQNDDNNDDVKNCQYCVSNDVESDGSDDVILVEDEIEVIVIDDDTDENSGKGENGSQNDDEETVFDSWEDRIDDSNVNSDILTTENVREADNENDIHEAENDMYYDENDVDKDENDVVQDENYVSGDENDVCRDGNGIGEDKNDNIEDENDVGDNLNDNGQDENLIRTEVDSPITEISKSVGNLVLDSPTQKVTKKVVENDINNINVYDIQEAVKNTNIDCDENILNIDSKYDNSLEILITTDQIMQKLQRLSETTLSNAEINEKASKDLENENSENEIQRNIIDETEFPKQFNADIESQNREKESISGKRRSNSSAERTYKKCRYEEYNKQINITPKNYPQSKIDTKTAGRIQNSIVQSIIDNSQELPLLKCHGIKDGALVYSCHSEKSLHFLEDNLQSFHDLKMEVSQEVEENNRYKMAFRINTFCDEKFDDILSRLELYNNGLNTEDWLFLKKEQCSDFTVIYVEMDVVSFNYIRASKFCMYAGIDQAKFSIVWT